MTNDKIGMVPLGAFIVGGAVSSKIPSIGYWAKLNASICAWALARFGDLLDKKMVIIGGPTLLMLINLRHFDCLTLPLVLCEAFVL